MKGRLPVVVRDVHLGVAVLHQLHQDLPVTLAAGQVQGGAALLILPVIGTAAGVGEGGYTEGGVLRNSGAVEGSRLAAQEPFCHAPAGWFQQRAGSQFAWY